MPLIVDWHSLWRTLCRLCRERVIAGLCRLAQGKRLLAAARCARTQRVVRFLFRTVLDLVWWCLAGNMFHLDGLRRL